MVGGYLLGSDAESITFDEARIGYRRAGATHAVDPQDPANTPGSAVGYAICGKPVRIWTDAAFDPSAPEAHDACIAAARSSTI